jgi:hypothetical protein
MILWTPERYILPEWILRPQCKIRPPTRLLAVVWLLAHIVHFQTYQARDTQMADFIDFIRMHKRNLYTRAKRSNIVANNLRIVKEN